MELTLTTEEARVLGCLIEKEIATPEYYPLSLNSLVNACNQKSNRNPVMMLDEPTVEKILYTLRIEYRLTVDISTAGSRIMKYRHNLPNHWTFSPEETAILCELLVRGPQTPGDLRSHASRLCPLTNSAEVEHILQELAHREEDGPFVVHLEREPGKRERRWATTLCDIPEEAAETPPEEPPPPPVEASRMAALEEDVEKLKTELAELKTELLEFKQHFE